MLAAAVLGAAIAGAAVRGDGSGAPATPATAITSAPTPGIAPAPAAGAPYAPGEILIKFRPGAKAGERAAVRAQVGAAMRARFRSGAEHWRLPPGLTTEAALAHLAGHPLVEYAEPNYVLSADRLPDDPRFGELHGFRNTGQTGGVPGADIDAVRAWNILTGSRDVIVAVIDSGIDASHPDLAANIYTNPGEISGNGVDDDGNGFIDDARGWDFVNNDNNPRDDNGHGTHVAGTIGAVGDNGIGVTGVCWQVSILPVKFLASDGLGLTSDAIRSIDYAHLMGALVLNASWGGPSSAMTLRDAIATGAPEGVIFVAAAGNSQEDNDRFPQYPAAFDLPNIVAVAATDEHDELAYFSSWGAHTILLGAPGVSILSTVPDGQWTLASGTSMATPMVAGAVALLDAAEPGLEVGTIVDRLAASADPVPALAGRTISGGRLNVFRLLATADAVPPAGITDLVVEETGSTTARLRFTAPGDDAGEGRSSTYDIRFDRDRLDPERLDDAPEFVNRVVPGPAGGPEVIEVDGLEPSTTYAFAVRARDEWETSGPASNVALGTTLGAPALSVLPETTAETLRVGQSIERQVSIANAGEGTLDWSLTGTAAPAGGLLVAPWLSAQPAAGRTGAGQAQPVTLRLDASGLAAGDHEAVVTIRSNDAARPVAEHRVTLTVHDAPAIAVVPGAIDFGLVFTGAAATRPLSITNTGTTDLAIAGLVAGDPSIGLEPGNGGTTGPFVLSPSDTRALLVVWTPAGPGPLDSTIAIDSDAANTAGATHTVALRGVALAPPGIVVEPQAFDIALDSGQSATWTLRLANGGGSALEATIAADGAGGEAGWLRVAPTSVTVPAGGETGVEVTIDAARRPAGVLAARLLIDSNDPARARVEVPVSLDVADAPHLAIHIPRVVLESRAGFEATGMTVHRLAARLAPAGPGTVDVQVAGDFGNSFEVATIDTEGGTLGSLGGSGEECVVAGRQFAMEAADLAAQFADGALTATVRNAASVDPVCESNDHAMRLVFDVAQDRLDFGTLLPGERRREMLTLENDGSLDLAIAGISAGGEPLTGGFTLAPGAARAVDVPFTAPVEGEPGPSAAGGAAPAADAATLGELVIESDDPGRPRVSLPLVARVLPQPLIELGPAAIDETLLEGHAITRPVVLRNHGSEAVDLTLAVEGTASPAGSGCGSSTQYVASFNQGQVRAVNPATGGTTLVAGGLYGPRALVVGSDGRRLYAAEFDGRLASVDVATGAIARIETGHAVAQGLVLEPGERVAWLTTFGEGALVRVDLSNGTVATIARGLANPQALALDRLAGRALVAEPGRQRLTRVDLATGVASLVAGGLEDVRGLAVDPTGTIAWVSLASRGVVAEVDLLTGATRERTTGLSNPGEIALDPVTGRLLVSELGGDRIVTIDPATGAIVAAVTGLPSPSGIALADPGACAGRFAFPSPRRLTLPAGTDATIDLRLDATGLVAGAWTADLVAGPTEPFAPLARLPLALAVTPRPRIAVVGKPIALGTLRTFSGLGARTTHSLTSAVAPGSDGVVELTAEGDFDSSRESATVVLEGVVLGSVGNLGTTCTAGTASFPVDRAALLEASKDGVFDLTVQNTLEVASSCTINRHRVTLRYDSADTASGVDFRDITLGTDRAIPLLVRNDGGAPLVVDAIGVSSTLCVALSEPLTLAPGASRDVFVRCTPVAAGPFEATLRAASNDPDRPLFEVSLFGVGVEPPRLVVEPAAVSADVPEGRTAERALEISNAGGRPLTVSAAAGAGFVQVAPPGVIVEPGGRVGLTVTLRAAGLAIGGHTAIINLTSNDPARALVEVPATITVLPDADRDGIVDGQDICPSRPDPDQADSDDDGHGDACDNCPATTNPGQEDDNADGSGDACQPIVIFTGLRQVAGERLVAEARARDPQVDQALSGEIRFEHVGVGQPGDPVPPPIVYVIESWRPGIWPIGGLVPGQAYRLVLSVTDGTTVPRAAEAQFVSQGERTLVIDMPPQPVIAAPATVECDRPLAGLARLDGRASSDPDTPTGGPDDIVEHEWFRRAEDGGLVPLGRGAVLDGAVIPLGVISVILRVTDSVGESAETDAVVVVRDTAAPSLRLSPEPAVLWPPDRTLRRVSLNPIAADLCDPSPAVILKGVTSSESAPAGSSGEPGAGAGVADASGTACDVVELEAARSPTGPGRTYVVTCEARDRSGSGVSATATIVVPRNLGGARR